MKKRLISMVMTAVMALTLVVAAAPVEANATAQPTQPTATTVTYSHSNQSVGADYLVEIPTAITFTATDTTVNVDVKLTDKSGNYYNGSAVLTVAVTSDNGYTLTADSGNNAALPYTLTYDTHTNDGTVGTLKSGSDTAAGTATLTNTNAAVGESYSDVLTYTVTAV